MQGMGDFRRQRHRIERHEEQTALTKRVEDFIVDRLRGRSLDNDGSEHQRPDFECLNGLVVIELKNLETSPRTRLENVFDKEIPVAERPNFFGSWPVENVVRDPSKRGKLNQKLYLRLKRAIERVIKKANDQLAAHRARSKRLNTASLVFLINEDHEEYDPQTVGQILVQELGRIDEAGAERNRSIDAVLYFTERHAALVGGEATHPLLHVEGPGSVSKPWTSEMAKLILKRWADYMSGRISATSDDFMADFEPVEVVPSKMKQHEKWGLDYRRRPYMSQWSNEAIRNLWEQALLVTYMSLTKSSPIRPPEADLRTAMERITHIQEECSARGLPLDFFKPEQARFESHVSRMGYPEELKIWLNETIRF